MYTAVALDSKTQTILWLDQVSRRVLTFILVKNEEKLTSLTWFYFYWWSYSHTHTDTRTGDDYDHYYDFNINCKLQ